MGDDVLVSNLKDVKFRLKNYTGGKFYSIPKYMVCDTGDRIRWISEIAIDAGEDHFIKRPCTLSDFKCYADLLYKTKIYSFKITWEKSVNWNCELKEITDYTEIEGE